MRIAHLLRSSAVLAFCLLLVLPANSQNYGNIGPSKGEVIGAIAGAAAVITVVVILVYHETHKHPSITGCLASGAEGLSLKNEKDKRTYALSGDSASLKAGERITLKGKKVKELGGRHLFQVEKLVKDYGACSP